MGNNQNPKINDGLTPLSIDSWKPTSWSCGTKGNEDALFAGLSALKYGTMADIAVEALCRILAALPDDNPFEIATVSYIATRYPIPNETLKKAFTTAKPQRSEALLKSGPSKRVRKVCWVVLPAAKWRAGGRRRKIS